LTDVAQTQQSGSLDLTTVPPNPTIIEMECQSMITRRQITASTGALLLSGLLAACVTRSTYDQLNQQLSAEISQGQVHITRLQGAIKVTVNSELLFPSGGWQMPPQAAKTIAEMAPVLAPMQTAHILIIGYTDDVPIGPELRAQGIASNQELSLKRAQTVMQYLISQGVNPNLLSAEGRGDADPVAPNATPEGRAQNRRVELTLPG
jgi:chemotaxis protein MotB